MVVLVILGLFGAGALWMRRRVRPSEASRSRQPLAPVVWAILLPVFVEHALVRATFTLM